MQVIGSSGNQPLEETGKEQCESAAVPQLYWRKLQNVLNVAFYRVQNLKLQIPPQSECPPMHIQVLDLRGTDNGQYFVFMATRPANNVVARSSFAAYRFVCVMV